MNITSATFVKGVVEPARMHLSPLPHVVFIGRSNVGKSSTINAITKQSKLAKTSSLPGKTKEINVFNINERFYLIDLPGYGFARLGIGEREKLTKLINGYLFVKENTNQLIVLIIDALVGPTDDDLDMLSALEEHGKHIVVAANKIDKIKPSLFDKQMKAIRELIGPHTIVAYSSKTKKGVGELIDATFGKIG